MRMGENDNSILSQSWRQICWITFKSITIFESPRLHLPQLLNHPITLTLPTIHRHHNHPLHTPTHHQANIAVSEDCIDSTVSSTIHIKDASSVDTCIIL